MKTVRAFINFLVSLVISSLVVTSLHAHEGHNGEAPAAEFPQEYFDSVFDDVRNIYTEPGSNPHRVPVNDSPNEFIDAFAGLLQHRYADIVVPANGGLNLSAQRNYLGVQPHQFKSMTSLQRSVNGLGWQMHFGKLVLSSFSNASLCEEPITTPKTVFSNVVNEMEASFETATSRTAESLQLRIQTMRNLLSQRVFFSDQDMEDLVDLSTQEVHDLEEVLSSLPTNISIQVASEQFDLSDIVPGNDTSSLQLARFFVALAKAFTVPYTTRDSIAYEFPDGSRHSFFRDDVTADGSLISLSRLKLRCDSGQMVVFFPNGTKHMMTEYENFIGQRQSSEHNKWLYWGEPSWSVSQIVDVHGNEINLTYAENSLGIKYVTGATSTDTNALSLTYTYEEVDTPLIKLASIEAGSKKWDYAYETVTLPVDDPVANPDDVPLDFNVLDTVTRPDGRTINYVYDPLTFELIQVTSAYGLVTTYTYQDIDIMSKFANVANVRKLYSALNTKQLSGSDIETVNWSYQIGPGTVDRGQPIDSDVTTITGPYAIKKYYHYGGDILIEDDLSTIAFGPTVQSLELAVDTKPVSSGDTSKQFFSTLYKASTVQTSSQVHSAGSEPGDYLYYALGAVPLPTQGGVRLRRIFGSFVGENFNIAGLEGGAEAEFNFGTLYDNYDAYGSPQTITEFIAGHPNSGASNRVHQVTYSNDTSAWILGLPTTDTMTDGLSSLSITSRYNTEGRLTSLNRAGVETTFTYFDNGELKTIEDANGHVTTFGEYKNGVAQSVTNAENEATEMVINPTGTIASVKDPLNRTTTYAYDNLDRVTSITPPTNAATTVTYDTANFTQTASRGGLSSVYSYDVRGRLLQSNVGGIVSTSEYDLTNRRTFVSNPGASAGMTMTYDALNRVTSETDQVGASSQFSYSGFDSVTETNKRNVQRRHRFMRYGFERNLSEITEPITNSDARNTKIVHNVTGQVVRITQTGDGVGQQRLFEYNNKYFLSAKTDPEIGRTLYAHDSVGNVTSSEIEATKKQTGYAYDKVDRLMAIDYPTGTDDIAYGYYNNGLLQSVDTGSIQNSYSYDANNNLEQEAMSIGGRFPRNYTLNYTYNNRDQLASIQYPDGLTVGYSPDTLGRPQQVGSFASSVSFTPEGQLSGLTMGNGKTLSYGYDNRLLATSVTTPGAVGLSYTHDPMGNVASITNSANTTHNVSFAGSAYDGIDRLNNVSTASIGAVNHNYDALGNLRQVETDSGAVQEMQSYTSGLNLRHVINNQPSKPNFELDYDGYGNVVNKVEKAKNAEGDIVALSNQQFIYDDASRLQTVEFEDAAGQNMRQRRYYRYDGHKQRVVSEVPGTYDINYSFYSLSGNLMFEESIDTCRQTSNIRLGSLLLNRRTTEMADPDIDGDNDTVNNCLELVAGLNAALDTDAALDSDGDGISNADELNLYGTLIDVADSDGDTINDGDEVATGSDPNMADTDRDGIDDGAEVAAGLDPTASDTDHDGVADGVEQQVASLNALDASDGVLDLDSDTFSNRQESLLGFDPSSSASTPFDNGRKAWSFRGLGKNVSAPAIASDQILHYGTDTGNVYAVYPDGTLKWSFNAGAGVYGSVVLDERSQTVYFSAADGYLYALDNSGTQKWRANTNNTEPASPAIDPQGNVYIASGNTVFSYDDLAI